MARIIPFRHDAHREAQLLLPWYARGLLDGAEQAQVEAHLGACADCAAELELERTLGAELAGLPLEADRGWARLRRRIGGPRPRRRAAGFVPAWAAAAAVALAVLAGAAGYRSLQAPSYQTLAAPAAPETVQMMVIFRPDTAEADLRRILAEANARFADGPTESGAYVLTAPHGAQSRALTVLRRQPQVVLAQPLAAEADPR
jgi:hypothetical protein